jgi:DNA polymerase-3 subunit alpha
LADLAPRSESQLLAGIVAGTRTVMTRRGKMGIVALDDGTAVVDVTVYSELFDAHRDLLKTDQPLVIMGKAQHDEFSGGIRVVADSLYDLVSARSRFAREMRLSMNGEASRAGSAAGAKLRSLLAPYRKGPCPIAVRYENPEACVEVRLGDDWRVSLDDRLLEALGEWLKPENVEVLYQ